jgi:hypothetical protein
MVSEVSMIDAAMSYDMTPVMARYGEKTRLPQEALDEHEREIKRFLAMCAMNPGRYGMRGPLDELWHTFIIFTSAYAEFCRQVGGRFIHHLPSTAEERTSSAASDEKTGYIRFLEDYEEVFRETPVIHLWPRPGSPVEDPSCDQCGSFCAETCAAIQLEPPAPRGFG